MTNLTGKTVSLKLVNGDELIAKLKKIDGGKITLSRPMKFMLTPDGPGLISPLFTSDLTKNDNVIIDENHIVMIAETDAEVAPGYIQQTTGITTIPTPSLIMPT